MQSDTPTITAIGLHRLVTLAVGLLILAACQGAPSSVRDGRAKLGATATDEATTHPAPLPISDDVVTGDEFRLCPSVVDVSHSGPPSTETIQDVLSGLASDNLRDRRAVSDRSFWTYAERFGTSVAPEALSDARIVDVTPAAESARAQFLANACGTDIVNRSWLVRVCPASCPEEATSSASMISELFLLERNETWLIWTAA